MFNFYKTLNTQKKTWSQSLSLVPRSIGLRIALSVETSNAESPTPVYRANTSTRHQKMPRANVGT